MLDVPSKLSAQVRVFATGNGRKTDPVDAHSVAMVALRTPNLVRVEVDDDLVRDMTEILTSMWARLYGKRAAEDRAKRALAAAAATGDRGAA